MSKSLSLISALLCTFIWGTTFIDQDTGSAIRGKARADLYFGTGQEAGAKAGHYHEKGEAYYLLKKS